MTKLFYKDSLHKELCTVYKTIIYDNYREYYGRKDGHTQFQMWNVVTDLDLLKIGAKRSVEMNEPEIEREEG